MQPKASPQKQDIDNNMGGTDDAQGLDKNVEVGVVSETTEPVLPTYTEEEERKLVRKIDWLIMPFLWGYATLSAVDVCQ